MKKRQLIGPFTQLLTMDGIALKGAVRDTQLEVIQNGALLIEEGLILEVGTFEDLYKAYRHYDEIEIIELTEEVVCLPGFIDCHTHICFGGSRAKDYGFRNAGSSYLEIAANGGGIWDTVAKTRDASNHELIQGIVSRAKRHLNDGITTIEVKSGYGLSVDEELKMLHAIQEADKLSHPDLIATCLAAHSVPKDFDGNAIAYLEWISKDLFPILKQEKLTNRIDAFVEQSAFSENDLNYYFQRARAFGFDITIHADQFSIAGSKLAVQFQAVSADHLEASGAKEIELLAQSNVVATALPGASLGLGCGFAPARKLLDAGACLAIASDWNPGSAPMGDLVAQASILGSFEKLTNAEVLSSITFRSAHALRLKDRGILVEGKKADFTLFPTDHYNEITYHQGRLKPSQVWKNGCLVFKQI